MLRYVGDVRSDTRVGSTGSLWCALCCGGEEGRVCLKIGGLTSPPPPLSAQKLYFHLTVEIRIGFYASLGGGRVCPPSPPGRKGGGWVVPILVFRSAVPKGPAHGAAAVKALVKEGMTVDMRCDPAPPLTSQPPMGFRPRKKL